MGNTWRFGMLKSAGLAFIYKQGVLRYFYVARTLTLK